MKSCPASRKRYLDVLDELVDRVAFGEVEGVALEGSSFVLGDFLDGLFVLLLVAAAEDDIVAVLVESLDGKVANAAVPTGDDDISGCLHEVQIKLICCDDQKYLNNFDSNSDSKKNKNLSKNGSRFSIFR